MNRHELESRLIARAWRDPASKAKLLRAPAQAVAQETGREIPRGTKIRVLEEKTRRLFFVLPAKPENADSLTEEELEAKASGSGINPYVVERSS